MPELDIPALWEEAAERVLAAGGGRVLVLGASDVGKSAFCRFLARKLFQAGHEVALVDADIGQKDIGPPATVTLGRARTDEETTAAVAEAYYFVGATNPMGRLLPLVLGTMRLVELARAPFVLINTTGLVHGVGRILKGYKVEGVRPDLIVAIQRAGELEPILRAYRNHLTLRLVPSPKARARTGDERREARETAFREYFSGARPIHSALDRLVVQRSLLFTGTRLEIEGCIHAERTAEGIVAVSGNSSRRISEAKVVLPKGFERNLLCGVAEAGNRCLGLAIVEEIDFARRTISLLSPVAPEAFEVLQLGDLYLASDGRELRRVQRRRY